jgi:hypothetical protein
VRKGEDWQVTKTNRQQTSKMSIWFAVALLTLQGCFPHHYFHVNATRPHAQRCFGSSLHRKLTLLVLAPAENWPLTPTVFLLGFRRD